MGMRASMSLSVWFFAALAASACNEDLGECDPRAAREVVYGDTWQVATKGQALMHDSCGAGSFCHSSGAKGKAREGVPAALNFDVLPRANGWPSIVEHTDAIWNSVADGMMPPKGEGAQKVSDSDWTFDPERRDSSERLPSLATRAGKAAFRNWLACGAPVVNDSTVPLWARPPSKADLEDWSGIHETIVKPQCARGGCHTDASAPSAGDLSLEESCQSYQALLAQNRQNSCASPRLVPGDVESSFLKQIEQTSECADPMPPAPAAKLADREIQLIRAWIEHGAPFEGLQNCGGT